MKMAMKERNGNVNQPKKPRKYQMKKISRESNRRKPKIS